MYIWKRRSVPGGTDFSLLMALMAGWVLVSALEYSSAEAGAKLIFAKLAFAGGVSIPPLWLLFSLEYCYPDRPVGKKLKALIWALPAIAAVLTLTNEYHGLIWSSISPAHTGFGDTLIYTRGIAAWAITVYSFAVAIPGFLLLFLNALRSGEKDHRQPASLLLGAIIVLLLSGASQSFLIAGYGIDLTPLALAIMGVVFAWGVFRHRIFELMPVAAEKLIENMADGVLVLNKSGVIVKINATARRKMGVTEAAVGQPAEKALAEWPLLAKGLKDKNRSPLEIAVNNDNGGMPRWVDTRVSYLQDEHARPLGTLVVLRDITERKLAEETLLKSRYDLLKAEQLANIGYFELDLERYEAHVSEGCVRIYGFPPGTSTVSFQQFTGIIHPEDAAQMGKAVGGLVKQGKAQSINYRIVLPDGSVRHVYSESEMMPGNGSGATPRMFGIVHDITEHKLAEEALRKSEHDLRKAERLANIGYFEWKPGSPEARMSEGCARMFGFHPGTSTILFEQFLGTVLPADAEKLQRAIEALLERGEAQSVEYRITLPDGSMRYIHSEAEMAADPAGAGARVFGIVHDITERRLYEESLRKSEHDRAKAEQLAHIGYYDWDLKTQEARISAGCTRIFGFPEGTERIAYETFTGRIHPEDADRVKRDVHSSVWQGKTLSMDYRIVLSDGSVRYVRSESEAAVKDTTGAYTRQFGVVQDITERKLSEETLRKSEHDRIKAERLAHLGYYYWDVERKEVHISEGCVRIFGLPPETRTIAWDAFMEMVYPEDRRRLQGEVNSGARRDASQALEFRVVVPDGSIRYVFIESEAVVRDPASGRLVQFGIVQDLTERRLAEETVRQTEEKYRTIVETANESICIVDNQARLAFINSKAADMLGYAIEEVQGHSVYEFVDREYHGQLSQNLVTKRLGARDQTNYKMRCKNGDVIWALSSSSPLYDDKGEITGLLVMLTDITDLKVADEQLKASLREKDALLKEVHHRVKNNLQIITSLLNLQSVGVEDSRYLEMVRDSQNRIKSMALVHELLYKSKDLSNIDISEYLQSLILNISRSYSHMSGNVALRTEIEKIDMDIDRAVPVGIIVTELVSNAYKYAFPEGRAGEISVELRRDEGKIVLTISDNGVGLPEGFEIAKTGTLGLQLVEMLTEQIEGELQIESGGRTVFRIILHG